MGIPHILKIDGDKLGRVNAGLRQLLLDQLQHHRLSTPANAGHDLDEIRSNKRPDTADIQFPFDHSAAVPLLAFEYSIAHLQLNIKEIFCILSNTTDKIQNNKKFDSYKNSAASGKETAEFFYASVPVSRRAVLAEKASLVAFRTSSL